MEIPQNLKTLYKHWLLHTKKPENNLSIDIDRNLLSNTILFANERMRIWEKKTLQNPRPYTQDPILERYKFCNIYRELDKQTITIHTILKKYEDNFDLWLLNLLYLRFVCNPTTVERTGFLSFDEYNNKNVYTKLKQLQSPKYGTAYIFPISVIQGSQYPTREEFFCFYLPKVSKLCSRTISKFDRYSVTDALKKVLPIFGFNFRFHWTEVFIDIAYQYPQYIDLYKQFPIGPGSKPTINKFNPNVDPEKVCLCLVNNQPYDFKYLTYDGNVVYLSAENWEGIGCEFRKYSNLKNGDGRHRLYI